MNIDFKALAKLSKDDLQQIPQKQLVDSIIAALQVETDTCPVFNFVFNDLIRLWDFDAIIEVVYLKILPQLKIYFDQAFNGNNDEIDCEKLETALYLFFTCINNSHRKLIGRQSKDYHMAIIGNLSINCLHVLNLTMNVMHKIPEPMHKVIMDIQRTLMAIFLSEHFRLRPIISELHLCQKVLKGFIRLAYQKSQANDDPKELANTWKLVSKLANDFAPIYRSIYQGSDTMETKRKTDFLLDWMGPCIQSICLSIQLNVQRIFEEITEKDKLIAIKIAKFFTMMLESLSKQYSNDDFRSQEYLMALLEFLADITCDEEELQQQVEHLDQVCSNVLKNVFDCERFASKLFSLEEEPNVLVGCKILTLLIQSPEISNELYLNHNAQSNILYYLIFGCVPQEMARLCLNTNLYDEIVSLSSFLLIKSTADQQLFPILEEVFCLGIISDDLILGYMCSDVWKLFLRQVSETVRNSYFEFWSKINNQLNSIPQSPCNVFVKQLVGYSFSLLSQARQITILEGLQESNEGTVTLAAVGWAQLHKLNGNILRQAEQSFKTSLENLESGTHDTHKKLMDALSFFQQIPATGDAEIISCLSTLLVKSKMLGNEVVSAFASRALIQEKLMGRNGLSAPQWDDSPLNTVDVSEITGAIQNQFFPNLEVLKTKQTDGCTMLGQSMANDEIDNLSWIRIKNIMIHNVNVDNENHVNGNNDSENDEAIEFYDRFLQNDRQFCCDLSNSCVETPISITSNIVERNLSSEQTGPDLFNGNLQSEFERSMNDVLRASRDLHDLYTNNENALNLNSFKNDIGFVNSLFHHFKTKLKNDS